MGEGLTDSLQSPAAVVWASLLGALLYWLLRPDPQPHAGVYRQPGRWYWIKRAVFAVMFRLRARRNKTESEANTGRTEDDMKQKSRGYGHSMSPHDMEHIQPLPDHPYAMDSVYIGAYSSGEGPNISLRVGRRPGRQAEVWLVMWIPGVGCLQHPVHPDTAIANTDPASYSAGGLHFDLVHPMKTWRVRYSGQLRVGPCDSTEDKPSQYLDTSFNFQWDAFAPHFSYDSDLDPSLLGDAIAREQWSREYFDRCQRLHQTHYEQWGELRGTLSIEGRPTQRLRLKAIRDHSFGVRKWTDFHRYVYCFLYIENGTTVQVGAISQPGMLSYLKTGCLTYPSGEVMAVTSVDFKMWEVGEEEQQPPSEWALNFVADGVSYELNVKTKSSSILYHETDRGGRVHEAFCDVTLNGRKGWGLSEFFYRNGSKSEVKLEPTLPLLCEPVWTEVEDSQEELYLPFTSPACCSSALVGGKGAQLALLTKMSAWENVCVPPGLCVTLKAFHRQMTECCELQEAINRVTQTAVDSPGELASVCKETSDLISRTKVCAGVVASVREGLHQVFGQDWGVKRVAVRSSAAGEDGSEASSAGQMETFLGVMGETEICQALQKCWASAYAYQAVEYRRQHGQDISTSVGVVIQEMVPAEAAGVLFTADPVTNNATIISINANFGLGESVVSGKCEPDTVTVYRDWDDQLTIRQRQAGHKKTKVTMQDGGGVAELEVSDDESLQLCLTDDVILSLAKIGIQTEKYFGSPRDIEWAYAGGTVFLLQARPITTSELETEEELVHEFDSPLSGGYECLTTGNVGEMMPGAVTPLTLSTFARCIDLSLQRMYKAQGARQQLVDFPKNILSCGNHLFISLTETLSVMLAVAMTNKKVMELNLLGETRPDISMDDAENYWGRPLTGRFTRALNALCLYRHLNKSYTVMKRWEKELETYSIGQGCETASQLYADIDRRIVDFDDVWHWGIVNSARSGSWANILLSIVTQNSTDWTSDHFGDIALLLSQCRDVYSAEVPAAMQDLAKQIVQEGLNDTFASSTAEDCMEMLESEKCPVLRQKTLTFFQRHGHRCIREAEMREKSWKLDPSKLISVLKTILKTKAFEKTERIPKTAKQLISELKTPLPSLTSKILEKLLPRAWAAVALREWGKSLSVKMNDILKTAYWQLASLMVQEGRLPDDDLMFFLTHKEIGDLLSTRSARLVMKAQRRRKVLSKQMALHFPKITFGHPQPIESKRTAETHSDAVSILKGMPVSQGVVQGPARVVLSLADAHTIQIGDILVVNCTDVGWSPYFPLVAGLVTEIGGLISHGAVVAREYGIPCIVNVPDATIKVQNGSLVELDGRAGTLTMLA